MKRLIIALLFVLISSSLIAQNTTEKNTDSKNFKKILVSISANSKIENQLNMFDSDLLLELSKLNHLNYLKAVNNSGTNLLTLKLEFESFDSYYKWFNDKTTKNILNRINSEVDEYKIELEYIKI